MLIRLPNDNDRYHRRTVAWIDKFADYGARTPPVRRLADRVGVSYPGNEAAGIYRAVSDNINYAYDHELAAVASKKMDVGDPRYVEFLQSPEVLLRTGVGDCDDMTCLGASIAKALGVPHAYILHQNLDKDRVHHVYLVVKDGTGWTPVDPVYGKGPGEAKPGRLWAIKPRGAEMLYENGEGLESAKLRLPARTGMGQIEITTREEITGEASSATGTKPQSSFWQSPIGQAIQSGTAAVVGAVANAHATEIQGQAVQQYGQVSPAAAPTKSPGITPYVPLIAIGGGALSIALLLARRR